MFPSASPSYNFFGKMLFGPFAVPAGTWCRARLNSRDSRYWGFLDQKYVQGRANFVLFSIDSEEPFWLLALLKNPLHFFTKGLRWDRFFANLSGVPDLRGRVQKNAGGRHE